MDNVRFHHCEEIKDFLIQKNISFVHLPPYSPDLNPIENFFSCVKSKLNAIRPRASSKEHLIENIRNLMSTLADENLDPYYRSFWERINEVNNRIVE